MLTALIIITYLALAIIFAAATLADFQAVGVSLARGWDEFDLRFARDHFRFDLGFAIFVGLFPPAWPGVLFVSRGFRFGFQFGRTPPTAKRIA